MKSLPNKIKNLNHINSLVKIPKYLYFNFGSFLKNKDKIISEIQKKLKNKIIVRSASFNEDNNTSNAGKFLSIPNINLEDYKKIESSITLVFKSYGKNQKKHYVLVQEYIQNAEKVGVIFTADPRNGSPFRTINFNDSNHTELITSGKSNGKIIYYFKHVSKSKLPKKVQYIETLIKKLEAKFPKIFLDIEFLILKKSIYVLQVRKLNTKKNPFIDFKKSLNDLAKKITKMTTEKSHLIGEDRYFSTMTDWNPAEIIGLKPKPLAISLYQSLITNEVWAESRVSLGYKDVTKMPLLYSFLGTPYIDIKTDINSFLISNLSDEIQTKLLKFYFKKFKQSPHFFYDKIESNLVINCISLDKNKYIEILKNSQLKKRDREIVIKKYTDLTVNLIFKLEENINKYKHGESLFKKLKTTKNSTINKIYLIHNICKNYGTLPFANLARMGFVAVEFLNSFENLKIISSGEKKHFLETIKSVSFEMSKDLSKSKSKFLNKYGHLRPNTYEISTPSYLENYKNYFKKIKPITKRPKKFIFSNIQKNKINKLLKNNDFKKINANLLINFIENSIYERESSKLFFTKIVDELFNQLKNLFKRIGLKEKDLQYLNIKKILDLYEQYSHEDIIKDLKKDILTNKETYNFNQNFNLPNIILNKDDIYMFEEEKASPTFVTKKIISSKFININKMTKKLNLDDKIVCIENADPGYDFIFNYKINGLITAFGGPNSHMSIRCNEFSLPAAIGIGEKKFQQLVKNNSLYLNCEKKMISGV